MPRNDLTFILSPPQFERHQDPIDPLYPKEKYIGALTFLGKWPSSGRDVALLVVIQRIEIAAAGNWP